MLRLLKCNGRRSVEWAIRDLGFRVEPKEIYQIKLYFYWRFPNGKN